MDAFPEEFNRQSCMESINQRQSVLINTVREQVYNIITAAVNDCKTSVDIEFPENLWSEHRAVITRELLNRFGEMEMTANVNYSKTRQPATIIRMLAADEEVPPGVCSLTVFFNR